MNKEPMILEDTSTPDILSRRARPMSTQAAEGLQAFFALNAELAGMTPSEVRDQEDLRTRLLDDQADVLSQLAS